MSLGQMVDDVEIANKGRFEVAFYGRTGGVVIDPTEIRDAIINFKKWVSMIKYQRSEGLTEKNTHYCPGCTHGILHKIVAEVMVELGILEKTIGIASVGCSVYSYEYFNCDMQQAPHGRACATATGVKRVLPNNVVFTYQGDGDLASIGIAETIHAANRGENITVIFANNANYGMTGGQMAPTTLIGQKTTTSQGGRNASTQGYPIKVSEMFQHIDGGVAYLERVALTNAQNVNKVKKAIKKGIPIPTRW